MWSSCVQNILNTYWNKYRKWQLWEAFNVLSDDLMGESLDQPRNSCWGLSSFGWPLTFSVNLPVSWSISVASHSIHRFLFSTDWPEKLIMHTLLPLGRLIPVNSKRIGRPTKRLDQNSSFVFIFYWCDFQMVYVYCHFETVKLVDLHNLESLLLNHLSRIFLLTLQEKKFSDEAHNDVNPQICLINTCHI